MAAKTFDSPVQPARRRSARSGQARPASSSSLWYGLAFLLLLGLAQVYFLAPAGRTILVLRIQDAAEERQGRRGRRQRPDDPRHAEGRTGQDQAVHHDAGRRFEADRGARSQGREVQRRAGQPLAVRPARLGRAAALLRRHLGLLLPPDERRRRRRDVVRAQPREDLRGRRGQGAVRGRGGSGRSAGRAQGDRRVPEEAEEVHQPRRPDPEGRPAGRTSRHRQDAAGARGRRRSARAVLQPQRIGIRRDVRRRRRRPHPRSVPAGRSQGAVHRLHRRARRARQGPIAEPARRPRRARADAESAARRNGRLRLAQGRHHHGRDQPAGGARPGAAPPRTVRSPGAGRQAGRQGARGDPSHPREGREDGRRASTCGWSRPAPPGSPVRISPTSSTRRRCSPRAATRPKWTCATSSPRSIA